MKKDEAGQQEPVTTDAIREAQDTHCALVFIDEIHLNEMSPSLHFSYKLTVESLLVPNSQGFKSTTFFF